MITSIQLKNFKCFRDSISFEFAKVNLLTGINGRGKSTLLQSLLLLSQSAWKSTSLKTLIFNDELVQLGNYDDVKNSDTTRSELIHFNLKLETAFLEEFQIQFQENLDEPLQADRFDDGFKAESESKNLKKKQEDSLGDSRQFAEIIKKTHYVSADRLGPVKYVEKATLPEFLHVGPRGENTINILASLKLNVKVNAILYRGNDSNSLLQQTAEWLGYILDGARINFTGKEKESSTHSLLLNNRNNSNWYKAANVGFGYSYILPLIVSGLIAKPGEILIVENPEAHLHPKAQSRIAEFFATVASSGIQVFVESHSEHILNGLRVAALSPNIEIKNEDLAIHYFNEDFAPVRLNVEASGKIANWPHGFFDQQEIDLAAIFKLGNR